MRNHRFFPPFVKTSHLLLIAALVGTLLVAPVHVARAATLQVDINNTESCNNETGQPYCNIQPAIDAAQSGDTINVASGQYFEQLSIGKSLTITGSGAGKTVIDG